MADTLPIFIDAATLAGAIDRDDVQVVAVGSPAEYTQAHIPGAAQIDMAQFTAAEPPVAGLLPDDAGLASVFSAAGLRNAAHIVAYDRVGDGQAARLLYTLDVMGHTAYSLLDAGLSAWYEAGYDIAQGEPDTPPSRFEVERDPAGIADRAWIKAHLDDNATQFLDVRSASEFAGTDVRSARGGHIPGAINLDWNRFKDVSGRILPESELRRLLQEHGVQPDCEIATYCQSHVRSSYAYLVLKALGYTRVRGYPGAWSDWGNATDTPVETEARNGG